MLGQIFGATRNNLQPQLSYLHFMCPKIKMRIFVPSQELWFSFFLLCSKKTLNFGKNFWPGCQICILRVWKKTLSNLLSKKKITWFFRKFNEVFWRFGKNFSGWCQNCLLAAMKNISSKTLFWYVFLWENFGSCLKFRKLYKKKTEIQL